MPTRTWIVAGAVALVAAACAGVAVYRARMAGYAEIQTITERVAAAIAAGDRAALAAEPIFRDHPGTVDWLVAQGPGVAAGYRVSVQRNGTNGYQLMSLDMVSHLGRIDMPAGDVVLGFWRDAEGGLTFVTAAASTLTVGEPLPD